MYHIFYKEVKKCIEAFIYGVNTPSRWGTQAPFSNITLDWTVPADLAELPAIVGGKEMDFKYKDCKKLLLKLCKYCTKKALFSWDCLLDKCDKYCYNVN